MPCTAILTLVSGVCWNPDSTYVKEGKMYERIKGRRRSRARQKGEEEDLVPFFDLLGQQMFPMIRNSGDRQL